MTGELPMVRLVMHHPDSVRLLRRALENAHHFHQVQQVAATTSVARELELKRPAESRRHERRGVELQRRQTLLQQLLDQLPTDTAPLPAPLGDT